MDKITHQVRLANWQKIIEQCNNRPQGTTVKQWVKDNGINEKTYYYWLRRVRREVYSQMTPEERLQERQRTIGPLVEEYFAWVKKQLEETAVPPKGKTAEGLRYSVNQEKYLKVFLTDGNVPIYSVSETAKLSNLKPYYYFKHLLTELPKLCDEKGDIDPARLDRLMPWSEELPEECRKIRR